MPESADKEPAVVTGRVRLLISMFAAERVEVQLVGMIPQLAPPWLTWNGAPMTVSSAFAAGLKILRRRRRTCAPA